MSEWESLDKNAASKSMPKRKYSKIFLGLCISIFLFVLDFKDSIQCCRIVVRGSSIRSEGHRLGIQII